MHPGRSGEAYRRSERPYHHGVTALDFLAGFLAVDRRDVEVIASGLRADGCPEDLLAFEVREILNPNSERTVPELYTGGRIDDGDERFSVRRQPPGWARER